MGVSVILKEFDGQSRGQRRNRDGSMRRQHHGGEEDGWHVTDLVAKGENRSNLVMVDPNKQDLLFCMGYNSTAADLSTYRYTLNQQNKEIKLKKYRTICDRIKPEAVQNAERLLLDWCRYKTTDLHTHEESLQAIQEAAPILQEHHTTTMAREPTGHTDIPFPIHCKLCLGAKIKDQKSIVRLAKNLQRKFGGENCVDDVVIVLGNWSTGSYNMRYHQPTKGIQMRRQLRKQGFQVYLLEEQYTSKICPGCNLQSLRPFQRCPNPRPHCCDGRNQEILVHGLLQCSTESCRTLNGQPRLWNWDMVATLNYKAIIDSQYEHGARPERFTRAGQAQLLAPV